MRGGGREERHRDKRAGRDRGEEQGKWEWKRGGGRRGEDKGRGEMESTKRTCCKHWRQASFKSPTVDLHALLLLLPLECHYLPIQSPRGVSDGAQGSKDGTPPLNAREFKAKLQRRKQERKEEVSVSCQIVVCHVSRVMCHNVYHLSGSRTVAIFSLLSSSSSSLACFSPSLQRIPLCLVKIPKKELLQDTL